MKKKTQFLLDLANLLENYGIAITIKHMDSNYPEVAFQYKPGKDSLFNFITETTGRCHVTAYDLRGQAGMSTKDANEMYQIRKRVKKYADRTTD